MSTSAPVNTKLIRHPLPYQPALFANRKPEIETVAVKVLQAQANLVADPIVNFWGVKGIGKTWILHELQHRYAYHTQPALARPTFAVIYTFPDKPTARAPARVVRKLAEEMLSQLSPTLSAQERDDLHVAKDKEDIGALITVFLTLAQRFVPLILLDSADKARQDDWESLESSLIEPLVSTGRILVVIAGRRQVPRWRRFEVRRRVMEPEQSRVRPFDKKDVTKQLELRQYDIPVDLFFPYTAGNPHLVDAIAQHIAEWTKGTDGAALDQDWFDRHRNPLLDILRDSQRQLLENVPARLLPVLDAVSLLRFYRLEALRFMLAREGLETEERPDGHYLSILGALDKQTEVVWWDRGRRAYVTSQVVRQLISRRQLLENREQHIAKHRAAVEMYWGWAREFPNASEDFIGEILFHLVSLYQADRDIGYLRSEAGKVLRFAHQKLNTGGFHAVNMQLDEQYGDHELLDLFPEDLRSELIAELERLMNEKARS